MGKKILLYAALVIIGYTNAGMSESAEVVNWSGLNTTEAITIINDIIAEGTPKIIPLSSALEQTIDGNGHSITGADGYYFKSTGTGKVTMKNLGKYSEGTGEASSFSYKNLNGETKSVNINSSVNSFSAFIVKENNTTDTASFNVENSVFASNTGTLFKFQQPKAALTITDSIFYNNTSETGASIASNNSTAMDELTLKNTIMDSNSGKYNINVSANNINLEDSIFENNTVTGDGGVLYGSGTLSIKNSYFGHNESAGNSGGGAILLSGGTGTTIENSKFEENKTQSDGGAIYFYSNNQVAHIKDSEFIKNSSGGDGGAISTGGAIINNVENTTFEDNVAKWSGGGIWFGIAASYSDAGPILMDNVSFKNNEAGIGGGLYVEGVRKDTLYITNSQFLNNKATAENHSLMWGTPLGGGIFANCVPLTVNNTTFSGNEAVVSDGYSAGGAIGFFSFPDADYYPHAFEIIDSSFSSNSAAEGGAIYSQDSNLSIIAENSNVVFSENTASNTTDDYNAGSDLYFIADADSTTLNLNAADGKQIIFNGTVAAYENTDDDRTATININKTGVTYRTYDGETESSATAGVSGEVQFNGRVGDADNYFSNINLYGGTLSIGQNENADTPSANPDGYLNDNNLYVKGDSILNTVNNIVGNFTPREFNIAENTSLEWKLDVDLSDGTSDTIGITENNGTLSLASFNVISDTEETDLRIKYSDTNTGGVVKDGYTITTSEKTYDVTAENSDNGSYIVFATTAEVGGLPAAIKNNADQYIITNGEDENVPAWSGQGGNVISSDIDINANGHSIYTENDIPGMVISEDTNVVLRNVKELAGFNDPLTNNGGTLSVIDSNIANNSGNSDIANQSGTVNIKAETQDVNIGSENTERALTSVGGTINVSGGNKVTFNGSVQGSEDATMNISTDTIFNGNVSGMDITQTTGTVDLTDLSGANYTLGNGTLNLGEEGSFAPDTFELNNGTVNIADENTFSPQANILGGGNINAANDKTGDLNFNNLTLDGVVNLAVDVDMNKEAMDTISATSLVGNGEIKVNQFNILSDTNKPKINLLFAGDEIKDLVSTDVTTLEGKIFRYSVNYDKESGNFSFAGGGGNSKGYNPAVMASPVAAQMQGYLTQLNSYDEAFRNMDMYMLLPRKVRQAMKYKNRTAISSSDYTYNSDKTIYDNSTGWLRTHTTFEKVPLKNGPKVKNIAYGTYFGTESQLYDMGNGWEGIWGLYAGYNGSHQSYNGISMYQNGGTLGVLGMAYKGNFFQGLTVNTSANGGEAHTNYGKDDFSMLMAGIASKTGYNIELKEGKFIIQPSLLLSYSFVNSFDYKNSAGINISSDPLHAIQVEPDIKFIANLKNGWQPYASAGMVWNIMDKTHYMANNVSLPELSVKPYVKYGAGVRKSWGERCTGFLQTYITNGGRNGVGIQLGFRWSIGGQKSNKNVLNKRHTQTAKKVIKSKKTKKANSLKNLT